MKNILDLLHISDYDLLISDEGLILENVSCSWWSFTKLARKKKKIYKHRKVVLYFIEDSEKYIRLLKPKEYIKIQISNDYPINALTVLPICLLFQTNAYIYVIGEDTVKNKSKMLEPILIY